MKNIESHIPIYQQLTNYYSECIYSQKIKPGGRIDSINKIMDRHHVSRETAKLVHFKLIEKGIAVAVHGKGTFVAIQSEMKKVWGVVIPFYSSNIEQLIGELGIVASKNACSLEYYLHYNNPEEEIRITGHLIQAGYEAIIVVPNYDETKTAEYYKRLVPGKSKVILADNTMAGSFFNYVIQSYDLGVKRAFNYLRNITDRNFLLMGNDVWKGKNLVFDLMKDTFNILIQELCPGRKLFVSTTISDINVAYLQKNNIGGVLSVQDSDSVRFIGRMTEWGIKIPDEVALVSYGDTELTKYFSPRITAIDCNYRRMAEELGLYISAKEKRQKRQYVISPDIIIRET